MGRYAKKKLWGGGGAVIASGKLIKVYLLWLSGTDWINKKYLWKKKYQQKKERKKPAPLQDSVREYIGEISVAMFLQIQSDIQSYFGEEPIA